MNNFIFRCDASPKLGLGHLQRCRALAHELQRCGAKAVLAGKFTGLDLEDELFNYWDDFILINPAIRQIDDADIITQLSMKMLNPIVIIDHYYADHYYQKRLFENGTCWLQFDGRAKMPFWADWVLNPRLNARIHEYLPCRQRKDTRFLLGSEFAFLRKEFERNYNHVEFRSQVKKILFTFGGGNDHGAILFCLEATKTLHPNIKRVILTTQNNPNNDNIQKWIKRNSVDAKLLIDEPAIAQEMAGADIGIISGGMTTFEASAMGLPFIIVQIAPNQQLNARAWHFSGAAVDIGDLDTLDPIKLRNVLDELIEDSGKRRKMFQAGRALVDCKGTQRVARILMGQDVK